MRLSDEEIKATTLHNITRKREQYINKRFAVKSIPLHERGRATNILEGMIKEGLLKPFKKSECVGANPAQIHEILRLLKMHRDKKYNQLY